MPPGAGTAVTVGTFDGLHLGHLRILEELMEQARCRSLRSLLVTFDPHPRQVLRSSQDGDLPLLSSPGKKLGMLAELGIEYVARVEFDLALSRMDPARFVIDYLLGRFRMEALVMGYDHGFGRDRSGGWELLGELASTRGFSLTRVPPVIVDEAPVSSSRIRSAVERGDMPAAGGMLGRCYSFYGRVVEGSGRGQGLGHPTANLVTEGTAGQFFPDGVYAAAVDFQGKMLPGVLHHGPRPTFGDAARTLEINLFDFSGDLYGCCLEVFLLELIRPIINFDSPRALVRQMDLDDVAARKVFKKVSNPASVLGRAV